MHSLSMTYETYNRKNIHRQNMSSTSFIDTAFAPIYGYKKEDTTLENARYINTRGQYEVGIDAVPFDAYPLGDGSFGHVALMKANNNVLARKVFHNDVDDLGTIFDKDSGHLKKTLLGPDCPVVPFYVNIVEPAIYMELIGQVPHSETSMRDVVEISKWLVQNKLCFPDLKLNNLGLYHARVVLIDVDGIIDPSIRQGKRWAPYTYGWKIDPFDTNAEIFRGIFLLCHVLAAISSGNDIYIRTEDLESAMSQFEVMTRAMEIHPRMSKVDYEPLRAVLKRRPSNWNDASNAIESIIDWLE